jgi:GTP-binding protein
VFDFKPGIDAGAEMLGRRGEDERLREERPAATRRKDIQEQMPERSETETRADVARRIDRGGPMSYEIGTKEDPDWADSDPGTETPDGGTPEGRA